MATLVHVSGWTALAGLTVGAAFTLVPGSQCAEGVGVYFAEGAARVSAAEGCKGQPTAIVELEASSSVGWWRTKAGIAKKFGRPVTWHTSGKSVTCAVLNRAELDGVPVLLYARPCKQRSETSTSGCDTKPSRSIESSRGARSPVSKPNVTRNNREDVGAILNNRHRSRSPLVPADPRLQALARDLRSLQACS